MSASFDQVLMKGGQAGTLIANHDWSGHSLGPIERWPRALKSALSVCLSSLTPILVWWGPQLIKFYNDAYRPVLGTSKHPRAMGAPGGEIWPEIWHIMHPIFGNVLAGGPAVDHKDMFMFLDRNGFEEETYFDHAHCPLYGDQGEVAGIFTTVSETTSKVLSERRLRTHKALAEQCARTRDVESACTGAAAVLHANSADVPYCLIYRVQGEAFQLIASAGASPEDLLRCEHARLPIAAAVKAGQPLIADSHIEPVLSEQSLREGRRAPEHAYLVPIYSQTGAGARDTGPDAVLVAGLSPHLRFDDAYRDFLALAANQLSATLASARAHEDQEQRVRALQELDRAKTSFFSNVSHELRTPLTLLLGPAEAALGQPDPCLRVEDLTALYRNARRLLRLVNMLLDFSCLEGGGLAAHVEPVDLAKLTTQYASAFESAFRQADVQLTIDCPSLTTAVYVDPELWEKVISNLLSNALKFTFEGEVQVSLRQVDGCAQLQVRDSGGGIPVAELPRVFTRFHRVAGARARSHEGSGIGLALSRDLVQLHGGTLQVASELGVGSIFTVRLPLGQDHAPAPKPPARSQRAGTELKPHDSDPALSWLASTPPSAADGAREAPPDAPRVLLAEDNADMRAYIARLLAPHYQLLRCDNGARALELAREQRPDLVLADVMMPELDGLALLTRLRADPLTQPLPVLLLSAHASEDSRIAGLQAGADDYLVKPFHARELLARVAVHVALGRARQQARSSQERLREIFQQAPVCVALLRGPDFVFELANERCEQMLGRRGMVGHKLEQLFATRSQGAPLLRMLHHVRETGETVRAQELKLRLARNGSIDDIYLMCTCQPLRASGLPGDCILAVAFDVTEQVALRRKFEALLRERDYILTQEQYARANAESANRVKDEFLAVLGHELRNPLAPIATALALMRQKGPLNHETAIIERQVGYLTRLVEDLLDVSRITRGKVELKRKPLNLEHVAREAVELASPLLEERQQHLSLDVPAAGLNVLGDRTRLSQVLANLLTNASKYSDRGSHIAVRGRSLPEDRVEICVRDQGIGIAPDMLDHVWNAFTQGAQAIDRSHGGLGLGLTIVRSLVELHGGSVSAFSEGRGKGSEFCVRLPLLRGEGSHLAEPRSHPSRLPGSVFAGRKVLLVDDNEDAVELLAEWFRTRGAMVETASDGLSALEAAKRFGPEVAVLDLGLPAMNGYEVARRLRAEQEQRELLLIAVTGYGEQSARDKTAAAGFDEHCVKPLDLSRFEPMLRDRLERGDSV